MWWLVLLAATPALYYAISWFLQPIVDSTRDPHATTYKYCLIDPSTTSSAPFPQSLYLSPDNMTSNAPTASEPVQPYLSVIVPAYNEQERLDVMMEETLEHLESRSARDPAFSYEIILVDDGSKDQTVEVALKYTVKYGLDVVRVLKLAKNQGKGGAVQQGMLHARGEYLLMVDADGATRFSDFDKVEAALKKAEKDGHGLAVGSRAHLEQQAIATRKWYRNVLMYGFHFLVSTLCVRGVRDTQCGFKLFTRRTAQVLFMNQHLRRWCFDVELLYLSQRLSIPIVEVAVNWQEIPGSKIKLLESSLLMGRDLLIIRICYMLGLWKVTKPLLEDDKKRR